MSLSTTTRTVGFRTSDGKYHVGPFSGTRRNDFLHDARGGVESFEWALNEARQVADGNDDRCECRVYAPWDSHSTACENRYDEAQSALIVLERINRVCFGGEL